MEVFMLRLGFLSEICWEVVAEEIFLHILFWCGSFASTKIPKPSLRKKVKSSQAACNYSKQQQQQPKRIKGKYS